MTIEEFNNCGKKIDVEFKKTENITTSINNVIGSTNNVESIIAK